MSGIPFLYNSQQENLFQDPFLKMSHQTLSSAGQFEARIVCSIGKGIFVDCTFPVILFLSSQARAVILSASPHFSCDSVYYNTKFRRIKVVLQRVKSVPLADKNNSVYLI